MTPFNQNRTMLLRRALPLTIIGGLSLSPGVALAAMVQVASADELAANDMIRWRQLVPPGQLTASFRRPVEVVSNNGVGATLSNESGPLHQFAVQPGTTAAATFDPTHGDTNDDILSVCCSFEEDITLNFASPVRGFGAYFQGALPHYVASVRVNGVSVFSADGNFPAPAANVSTFLGVLSDKLDIYSIVFTMADDQNYNAFLMDNLRLNTISAPPVEPPASAAPEPATWALFILGFAGAGATLRRRLPQVAVTGQ